LFEDKIDNRGDHNEEIEFVPSIVDIVGVGHGENFEHSFNDEDHSEDVVEQLQ